MHHLLRKSFLLVSICVGFSVASAEPNETLSQTLSRTSQSGSVMESALTANAYRQEPYQAEYDVQVPYQAEETYYESVPYTESEAYTDYEDYYDNDYICRDYTDYEYRCHTERDCDRPATDVLSNVIMRDPGHGPPPPGTGPRDPGHGPPPPDYGPRDPGHGPPPPDHGPGGPICRDRQVCDNEPVTRQRCGYEQVRKSRAVTKYRDVVRYRQEPRTRTVTRYRTETRCCETRYHDVFDHQWNVKVQVKFPQGTELVGTENELFALALSGSEVNPSVTIKSVKTIFGYRVADTKVSGGVAVITLQMVPRFSQEDVAKASIQGLQVVADLRGLSFKFNDNAVLPRVKSTQQLIVREANGPIVAQTELKEISTRENQGALAVNWNMTGRYEVILKVHREGVVIENGKVDFEIAQPLTMQVDEVALKNEKNIYNIAVTGQQILFKDDTIAYASVDTAYAVQLDRRNLIGSRVRLGVKTFSRTGLRKDVNGNFVIPARDLGISSGDMKYVSAGNKVYVYMSIVRKLQDGSKIQFAKAIEVKAR